MKLALSLLIPSYLLIFASITPAQVIEDGTLSTEVGTENNRDFTVEAGEKRGENLFHSFAEFSIPNNGSVSFNNELAIQNIITRVTGSSISNIDGLVQTNGTANLFLINPNGIIFGENARLNVGGSFIGTSAESLVFEGGAEFSANLDNSEPLLTVNVPLGLQFGSNPGEIVNRANFSVPNSFDPTGRDLIKLGLTVPPDETLALLGGNISFDGGAVASSGGNIELGSVAENSFVALEAFDGEFKANYSSVGRFQDIRLNNLASVDVSGESTGNINIKGKNIQILDGSAIISNNLGDIDGETVKLEASDTVEINGSDRTGTKTDLLLVGFEIFLPFASQITSNSLGTGKAGNIEIITNNLQLIDGGSINLLTFPNGSGEGGHLFVSAAGSINLKGFRPLLRVGENAEEIIKALNPSLSLDESIELNQSSGITSSSINQASSGDINIESQTLRLENGSGIATSPFRTGNAGDINITTRESIEIVGVSGRTGSVGSAIASNTFSQGNAGNTNLKTGRLSILNGGILVSSTSIVGGGDAGNITIDSQLTEINGVSFSSQKPSLLSSETNNESIGGNVFVNTDSLVISDRGTISIKGTDRGSPGNLQVNANSVLLSDRGKITAENAAAFDGGNIELNIADSLTLQENSLISARAFNDANGGNIDIKADFVVGNPNENNDILATAFRGDGGNINILSNGIFGITEGQSQPLNSSNDLDASSEFGMDGTITFNFPEATSNFQERQAVDVVDVRNLLNNNFCKVSLGSKYYSVGKGGIGISPNRDLEARDGWTDFRFFDAKQHSYPKVYPLGLGRFAVTDAHQEVEVAKGKQRQLVELKSPVRKIEPIQGWYKDERGRMVLTAKPLAAPYSSVLPYPNCNTKTDRDRLKEL